MTVAESSSLVLPFGDPAGVASSMVLKLAEDRLRELPNGRPDSVDDLLVLLALASQVEDEKDPNPRIVAAKVQMNKLGLGTKLELSVPDRLGLYLLLLRQLGDRGAGYVEGELRKHAPDPKVVVSDVQRRCCALWERVQSDRVRLAGICDRLAVELSSLLPPGLSLLPHQLAAVHMAREASFRHIFGDDMGLGKTIEVLACALLLGRAAFPMLIACPLSMVYKWRMETEKWLANLDPIVTELTHSVDVRSAVSSAKGQAKPLVLVGSWQQPVYHQLVLRVAKLGLIVGDESHYISNWDTARTQGFIRSRIGARAVLLTTGTLMQNGRHREVYSQLKAVDSRCLDFLRSKKKEDGTLPRGDRYPFLYRYCGPKSVFTGKKDKDGNQKPVTNFDGRSNEVEFGCLLNKYVTRRTKPEVFGKTGLPSKTRYIIPVQVSDAQQARFEQVRSQVRVKVSEKAREVETRLVAHNVRQEVIETKVKQVCQSEAMRLLGALRMEVGLAKTPWCQLRVRELLDEGHRPVVFCWHHEVAKQVADLCRAKAGSVLLRTGQATSSEREQFVREAETGSAEVLVLTSAYREGLSLVQYDRVLMLERWWQPAFEQQAEDRVHRIGQIRDVAVEYPVILGTCDDAIGELQVWKELGQVQANGCAEERVYQWLMA